ncbi:MAG: nucleotidyltransferase family protein [Gammaproteobacteria bacterium]
MIPGEAVTAFCQRWNITEMALVGSVLRPDFKPDSDIDVLARLSRRGRISATGLGTRGCRDPRRSSRPTGAGYSFLKK